MIVIVSTSLGHLANANLVPLIDLVAIFLCVVLYSVHTHLIIL